MSATETSARDTDAAPAHVPASVIASGERPTRPGLLSATLTFGWRGMLKIKHVPEQLLDVTVTPVLFVLMFTYLFGGAITGSTEEYAQFIVPGILVMSVLFVSVYSGTTINTDVTKGVVDRFRSLPTPRSAPLTGAILGDSVRFTLAGIVVVLVGLAVGFRPDAGALGVVAAIALVVVFASGLAWVFTTLGLLLRSPTAVTNAGFMAMFPLTFISNVFVDPSTLPGWLEAFVDVNPVSHLTTASRDLMAGSADPAQIGIVLGVAAAFTAVFAPITVHLYRTRA